MEGMSSQELGAIVVVASLALEVILRRIPNAWPITKIVYQMLDKIVKDRKD